MKLNKAMIIFVQKLNIFIVKYISDVLPFHVTVSTAVGI